MNLPTLDQTKVFLLRCIQSCNTVEQIAICREMIETFITGKYKHYESAMEIGAALNELDGAIEEQRAVMVQNVYEENNLLTLTA